MSVEKVREYFKQYNRENDVVEHEESSATVELAAQAVGVIPARIAKTLSFKNKEGDNAILIVTAGDAKIDNKKFKAEFGLFKDFFNDNVGNELLYSDFDVLFNDAKSLSSPLLADDIINYISN